VRPYEAELAALGSPTLVFVPDGALRTVPMAALHDGERYLVEKWALATTPGLSLTDPRALDRKELKVFLGGLSKSVGGFGALPYVWSELDSLRGLVGGEMLVDEGFALADVRSTLEQQQFNVVHIASHGEFTQDVDQSFLLTWDGRLTMQGLSDSVGLFKFRDTPIELLTLSACETAEGDDRAALGLAGVAIKAGARSALGTLWKVNDRAAADLMVDFYGQLKDPAHSKAAALRSAQLQLLADRRYDHPGYWAPFLLISNWL
jgi:CHAT domain-containing protein